MGGTGVAGWNQPHTGENGDGQMGLPEKIDHDGEGAAGEKSHNQPLGGNIAFIGQLCIYLFHAV